MNNSETQSNGILPGGVPFAVSELLPKEPCRTARNQRTYGVYYRYQGRICHIVCTPACDGHPAQFSLVNVGTGMTVRGPVPVQDVDRMTEAEERMLFGNINRQVIRHRHIVVSVI